MGGVLSEGGWVGRSLQRTEDERLLRGYGRFVDDCDPIAGAAHVAILRSREAHATLTSVDTSAAEALTGVHAVLTGAGFARVLKPFPLAVNVDVSYYPIAVDKVRYVGEPVAVVVAENRYAAEDALDRIRVDYEPLPRVIDPERAIEGDAPLLHDSAGTNVGNHRTFKFGDPGEAFASADLVVEGRYEFPRVSCTPIECYAVVASFDPGEEAYTAWANFHGPFILHRVMAAALGVASNKLRLRVPPDIGGAFGIKSAVYPYVVLMAAAARLSGRSVKWIEDRREHLLASSHGTKRTAYVRAAFTRKGTLMGLDYRFIDDVGAYIRSPEPATMFRCFGNYTGAYQVSNVLAEVLAVMTNKCPTGLNRGFGGPQLYFPLEATMDEAARRLGLDPLELRRRNLIPKDIFPYRTPLGSLYDSGDYGACVARAAKLFDYEGMRTRQEQARAEGRLFGIGAATIVDPSGTNMGYVTLAQPPEERKRPLSGSTEVATIDMDVGGGITVRLTTTPEGQGHETVAAQVVADELKVRPDQVTVHAEMDTVSQPWTITTGSYSSRFGPLGASALATAARRLRDKLREVAAHLLEVDEDDVELTDEGFALRGAPERVVSLREAAGAVHWNSADLAVRMEPGLSTTAYFSPEVTVAPNDRDQVDSSACYGFVADLVAVEIDPETFEIRIDRYVTVHDAGKILNPQIVEGQVYGGTVHGLAPALYEEFVYNEDNGQLLTASFMDYLCPTASESPKLTIDHLETPSPFSLLGAKGVGEASTMSAPPAIACAVSDALAPLGAAVNTLPVTPERLFRWISSSGASIEGVTVGGSP
jgi:2-furoyl-CoA dehydrogenase large subunit